MNSNELTRIIKSDTADILRCLDENLAKLVDKYSEHEPLTEARKLLSDAIVKAETSEVTWCFGPNDKVYRVEKISDGPIE